MRRVFRVSSTQRLIFLESAIETMLNFRQCSRWQNEAGGILLGRFLLDSDDLVVDEVSTPMSADKRRRFSFFRSCQHQAFARNRWENQRGTSAYLGLWHTHPESDPEPSEVDIVDWQQAVNNDIFEGNQLFFSIVGISHFRVWTINREGLIRRLEEEGESIA